MNVLHLSSNIRFGGSEQQLIYLVEATSKKSVSNFVFCFTESDLANRTGMDATIIAVNKQKPYSLRLVRALRTAVVENKIDLVHIHHGKFILTYMLADIFFGLKCKAVFSKKDMSRSSSFFSKIKYNYSGIYKITCVTEAIRERFKKIMYPKNHHKLMVLRDGLNVENLQKWTPENIYKSLDIPEGNIIIGNVANHVRAKGLRILILTLDYLVNVKGIKNISVVQIGRFTDLTEEYKALIDEKQLGKHIVMTGFLENGYRFTSQFDYFLMTSQSEGMPLTLLESFYYRIPVVSTKAGGIPEAIRHGENGMLAKVDDYVSLGDCILTLLDNPALRASVAEKAFELVMAEYTSDVMAAKTVALYNEALASKK